ITAFDVSGAEKVDGVLQIFTPDNAPRLKAVNMAELFGAGSFLGEAILPLQDKKISYFGQYIGLVVAETYEQARTAAEMVKVTYSKETPAIDLRTEMPKATMPKAGFGGPVQLNVGKTAEIIKSAPVKIEQTYTTRTEVHHPMEPHATIAVWSGSDKLLIYDATQGVKGVQGLASYFYDLKPENVQVLSPFVGGGFGCKGSQWSHILMTIMAAKAVKRPVKFVLTRQMMVTNVGRRSETIQKVALASDKSGNLKAIRHENSTYTTPSSIYFEQSGTQTKTLYKAEMREISYKVTNFNINSPTFMRAPGETPGCFALESAMDELAIELKIDPIKLRTMNHTAIDPESKLPFSMENIVECYTVGAEKFGWANRKPQPRMNRQGKYLIGHGMATATYPATRSTASAKVQIFANGNVKVFSATQDIGTGTYTIMAQTLADALGVSVDRISVEIGDSSLPPAPVSGGSTTAASVTAAVFTAGEMLKKDLMAMAMKDSKSKLNGKEVEEIEFANARFFVKGDTSKSDEYTDILKRNGKDMMEVCATSLPQNGGGLGGNFAPCDTDQFTKEEDADASKYSFHSFGAQFAEVMVDENTGMIRVSRFTSVQDIGRVLNEKTARSQIIGGVIYGLGQTLMEETLYDKRWANPIQRNLADYHIPCNLDVPHIEVHFIGKPDPHISPIGARGIGEIGITGVAAAV
ncbi:MAG: xanthine dehydrogenase family protein molybdopterin-binding subunit, partial [Acidobacteriota bacterium]